MVSNKSDKLTWPCQDYEYSQDGVCLNSCDCSFVHKKIRCTNKTEIKDALRYINKRLSRPGDIIIQTPEI